LSQEIDGIVNRANASIEIRAFTSSWSVRALNDFIGTWGKHAVLKPKAGRHEADRAD
jgi:hypothetical protein